MKTRAENMTALECMVDQHTMSGVLAMLSEIASLKKQHVNENWQDTDLARQWRKAELALDRLHINMSV